MNPCYCSCGCTTPLRGDTFCAQCGPVNWSTTPGILALHREAPVTSFGALVVGHTDTAWVARCGHCQGGPRQYHLTDPIRDGKWLVQAKTCPMCDKPFALKVDSTKARGARQG